jgi:hypothetical protein
MGGYNKTNPPFLHRYFFWSYVIALSLLAGIILLNYGIISRYLVIDPNNPLNARSYVSRMVNIAGRCATDAQTIEIAVWQLGNADTLTQQQKVLEKIQYSLTTLEKGYWGLQKGDPDFRLDARYNTEEIRKLFKAANQHFFYITQLTRELLEQAKLDSPQLKHIQQKLSKEVPPFVSYMQEIAFQYDEQATEIIAYWGRVALGLTIVSILLLVLIGLLIFRPVTRTIKQYFEKLQEQKQALENANRELQLSEKGIRQQAHRLHELNQQLLKTQSELISANQTKETLLSLLTQNLRVPLRTMRNITHLLTHFVEKLSKEEIRQSAQDLEYAINEIDIIAENIFTWLAIQKDELQIQPEKLHLNTEVLQEILAETQIAMDTYKISLHILAEQGADVYTDARALRLLLLNIVYFHINESPKGVHLTLAAQPLAEAGCVLRIETEGLVPAVKLPNAKDESQVRSHLAASLRETFSLIYKDLLKKQASALKIEQSKRLPGIVYEIKLPGSPSTTQPDKNQE